MRYVLTLIAFLACVNTVTAEELHVVLNGKAIHLDDNNYNEENWGLGVNYDFNPRKNWVSFLNASYFKDSNYNTSKYAGGGMKRRYMLEKDPDGWHVDAGLIAFLMTREDYKNNDPFFGALPFVAIGSGWFTLNVTYIPEVSPKHKDLLFFQAMVRVAEF